MLLQKIKRILNITDKAKDEVLNDFIEMYTQATNNVGGFNQLPLELEFALVELVVARFNQLGSEGLKQEKVDIISNTFIDDLFESIMLPHLKNYLNSKNGTVSGDSFFKVF